MSNLQVISDEKEKEEGFAVAKIVADAGVEAAQRPIKLLVPAVAAIMSWRTLTLALQIIVENEMFRGHHRISSEHHQLANFLQPCKPHKHSEVWEKISIILELQALAQLGSLH